jgi:hypothetical protein
MPSKLATLILLSLLLAGCNTTRPTPDPRPVNDQVAEPTPVVVVEGEQDKFLFHALFEQFFFFKKEHGVDALVSLRDALNEANSQDEACTVLKLAGLDTACSILTLKAMNWKPFVLLALEEALNRQGEGT